MKFRIAPRFFIAFVALLFCALLCVDAASATTLESMSLARMSRLATTIVRARCLSNSAAWDEGEIWTFTQFSVLDAWKGSPPARISVRLLGGSVGLLTSTVSGIPRFRPGEEVILFVEPVRDGSFSIVSWQQGTFRVRRDPRTGAEIVTQDTASFATFNPRSRRFETIGIRSLALDSFRARIDSALAPQGVQP